MKTTRTHLIRRILATFALLCSLFPAAVLAQNFTLTVIINGNGAGFVQASPIFCAGPATCTGSFASGTQVALSEFIGTQGNHFAAWSGCDISSSAQCFVTMTSDRTVTATFNVQTTTNEPVQSVVGSGDQFTCALSTAGGVKCVGIDSAGQLGNNDSSHATQGTPVDVTGLTSGVIDLSVGVSHACALTATGGVKCWGLNGKGQLGDGTTTSRDAPVDVTGLTTGAVKIAAGEDHTCALTTAGGVKCWGAGNFGQLGNNATQDHSTPVDVAGLAEVVTAIASGSSHSCVLTQAGGLKCWGAGQDGENGSGGSGIFPSPVDVSGLTSGVASFSLGRAHSCAVTSAGAALCWGLNSQGQLGDTTTTSRFVPTAVSGLASGVASISTRYEHTCAVMVSGSIKCWGRNDASQLDDGTTTRRLAPVDVPDITGGVMALALGSQSSCAHMAAGRVFCWGSWLTPASATQTLSAPTHIQAFGGIVQIDAGFATTCAATTTGGRCWGSPPNIGDAGSNQQNAPVDVQELGGGLQGITVGELVACGITSAGGVKCWGNGGLGNIGDGMSNSSNVPVDVLGISSGTTALAAGQQHACAVHGGAVTCWGENFAGQLGTGDTSDTTNPYTQPGLSGVVGVAAGQYHTCVVLDTGGVRCWGRNSAGQLGDNTFTDSYVPVTPVGLDSGVEAIVAGNEHTCALTTAGAVQCWGKNSNLQLGQGGSSTGNLGAPSPVPALTSGVTALASQGFHNCALMNDGTVQCWGSNSSGELGDNTHVQRSTPVAVMNLAGVQAIATGDNYSCALTWAGTVKCWGTNTSGQFGDGTTTSSNTPQGGGTVAQTLTLSFAAASPQGTPATVTAAASSGLAPALTSWTPNCTLTATTLSIDSAGRCGVIASQPGNAHIFAAPSKVSVANASGLTPQVITFQALQGTQVTSFQFTFVTASGGGSGNPVTFSSLTPSVCTATGSTGRVNFTITGGTCTVAADQAGNATYLPAAQATQTFQITVSMQTLSVAIAGAGSGTVTGNGINCSPTCSVQLPYGTPVSLTATPDANSRFVSWTNCGSSGNVCSGTLTGNASLTANFALANQPQAITFNPDPLPDSSIVNYQYSYQVSASSGLAVTVTSLTPSVCQSQNAGFALLAAPGTCTLAANQAGNTTYAPAPEVRKSFQVIANDYLYFVRIGTGTGSITGAPFACPGSCFANGPPGTSLTLTATPDPGSTFNGWSGCDSVAGNVCTVTIASDGQQVVATFNGLPAQSIAFAPLRDYGLPESPVTISATADSGLPVTVTSLTTGVCTISGNLVTLLTMGTCTLEASQAGDTNFAPAPVVDRSFNVLQDVPQTFVVAASYRLGEDDPGAVIGNLGNSVTTPAIGTLPLTRVGTPHYAAGASSTGIGVALNGASDGYASFGTVTDATSNFGVEAWVYSNGSRSGNAYLAFTGNGGTSGFGLLRLGAGYSGLLGGIDIVAGNGEIPVRTAEWTHLALVQHDDVVEMYVNGVATGFTSGAHPNHASSGSGAATLIGSYIDGTSAFDGSIDGVRFFTFQPGTFDVSLLDIRNLTVATTGGTGVVTSDIGGIFCGPQCTARYPTGAVVTLTAAPDPGFSFGGWSGDCSGTGSCVVTMTDTTNVTAAFSTKTAQTISFAALADRPLDQSPFTISATASSNLAVSFTSATLSICTVSGNVVTLVAPGSCTVAANQVGDATYAPAPEVLQSFQVTSANIAFVVGIGGNGTGTVSGGGINCGPTCTVFVPPGTSLTLTATADPGSTFTGWGQCFSGVAGNVCTVTAMVDNQFVTATFDLLPTQAITFAPLRDYGLTESPVALVASASSGLPVTFVSLTPAVCTTSGNSVTLVALGPCTIRASQPGNASFAPAPDVDHTFNVLQNPPSPLTVVAQYRLGDDDTNPVIGNVAALTSVPAVGSLPLTRLPGTTTYDHGASGVGIGIAVSSESGGGYAAPGVVTDATDDFGVEAWVKSLGRTTDNGLLVYTGNGASSGFGLLRAGAGYSGFMGGAGLLGGNGEIPVTTAWTHLALVRHGGVAELYVNGVSTGLTTTDPPRAASTGANAATSIGAQGDGTLPFDGSIDEVRFFTFLSGAFDPSMLNVRNLAVAASGTGIGTVTSDIGGISCSATCTVPYPTNAVVTLTATPGAHSVFAGWSGACSGTGLCVVTLSGAASVTATFDSTLTPQTISFDTLADRTLDQSPFTVSAIASSGLTVSFSSQTLPVCTVSSTSVTLVTTGTCTIRASQAGDSTYAPAPDVDQSFNVTAASFTLTVSRAGSGIGSVSGPGIDCGVDCSEPFNSGATVMLTAAASPGSSFMGWSGACSGMGSCSLTMDADKNVVASFERNSLSGARGDFDGDGAGDLLFHNADGRSAIWLMDGLTIAHTAGIFGVGTAWQVAHIADLDGDGKSDLVWQNPDGRVTIYLMNGTTAVSKVQILNAGPWTVTHTGDFDGDGKADLIFQNTDGTLAAWLMNGTSMTAGATILGPGTGWSITQVADFDGDGKDDLLFTHEDGRVAIWLMDGLVPKVQNQILNAGSGWTVTHVGDFDGDGKADLLWQNTDGRVAIWLMNGAAMSTGAEILNAGSGWTVTRTGDFDGDGKADLFFTHTDGRAAIFLMNGLVPTTTTQILNAGSGWTAMRIADMDGDGKSDIIWQHTDGRVAVWLMNGTTMSSGSEILAPGTGWSVSDVSQ